MKKQILVIILLAVMVVSCLALTACHTCEFGEWEVAKNPTCTQEGIKERFCSCGEKQITTIPATDHTEVVDTPVVATYGNAGLTPGSHCDVCGEVIIEQVKIPSLSEVDGSDIVVESGYYDDDEAIHYNYSYSLTINDDDTFTLVTMIVS